VLSTFAHEAAGATGTRFSLRPLSRGEGFCTTRAHRVARRRSHIHGRHAPLQCRDVAYKREPSLEYWVARRLVANPATVERPLNETPNAMALIFNRAVTLTGQFVEAGHFGLAHDANPGTTDVNEVRAMPDRTV
jgi:hypothetical protein